MSSADRPDRSHRPPRRAPARSRRGRRTWITFAVLVALPAWALAREFAAHDAWALAIVPLALSVATYFSYRADKGYAAAGSWRISEKALHLFALFGGWPGAFLAQRFHRHKTAKRSFQIIFWLIVGLHQLAAFDSLQHWRHTRSALHVLQNQQLR